MSQLSEYDGTTLGGPEELVADSVAVETSFSPLLTFDGFDTNYTMASNDFETDIHSSMADAWVSPPLFVNEDVLSCLTQSPGGEQRNLAPGLPELQLATFRRYAGSSDKVTIPPRLTGGPEATEALMANWFEQVCPAWSAFDSCLNPNRKIATELMHQSASVFNTLQSMSACFLSARLPQMTGPALRLLKKAAASVTVEADAVRKKDVLDTVPTAVLFSLFCLGTSVCWLDARRLGLPFLREAKDLLQRLSWIPFNASEDQLEMLAFFRKSLVYWEMLLSFVDDYTPSTDGNGADTNYEASSVHDIRSTNTDLFLHPWTGISTQTSRLFTRSITLCRSYRRRISKPTGSEISASAAIREIEEAKRLEQHLNSLEFTSIVPVSQTGDEKTPWVHLAYVAEAYQLASLLQLYLTFPDLVAMRLSLETGIQPSGPITCDKWTIPLAIRLTKLLEQIPPESGSRVVQPLLYICASSGLCSNLATDSPESGYTDDLEIDTSAPVTSGSLEILGYIDQMDTAAGKPDSAPVQKIAIELANARNIIMRRLDMLESSLQPRPIMVAKELVKAIWDLYDDENRGCATGHWLDVMEAHNLRSLFG